jgi:hypothetical protein
MDIYMVFKSGFTSSIYCIKIRKNQGHTTCHVTVFFLISQNEIVLKLIVLFK